MRPCLPTLKCYNLHALTIAVITKYTYIYFFYFVKYINLNTKNEEINFQWWGAGVVACLEQGADNSMIYI